MVAPPIAAASLELPPPFPAVFEQPMEKLTFPNEFPYEFASSTFSTSPEDSTETEDETTDDEDDFLAGLTRRLALSTQRLSSPSFVTDKSQMKPKVTESTQSGLGSPNGPFSQVPSPPTSPSREEDSLKVLSAAAGEVAKIKKANFDAKPISYPNPNPNYLTSFPQNVAYYNCYWLWEPHYPQSQMGIVPNAWHIPPSPVRAFYTLPTAVKSPSTGTGVFLPRKYSNPSDSPKKKSGDGCVKVVNQQKPKIEVLPVRCKPNSKAGLSTGRSKIDYVAGGGCLKHEKPLLQEWMY
ncbi:putative protein [Arabidopsis thaliana]|uniref:At3g55690 n=1 Tax=Arabidopsis thaliana TaxID=3702 RepID=Q9M053_ARATH|nr:uncharacterized protein AT3G55690 [Arabidopsis thaliana]AAQ62436.1 At3g55690 [Arabidopsis thaliana]AEE79423.1 hypothetical protein AT3G55690 [Arabidopsis thaliana]CAB81594.1 putative protein [Arabidopsis thaliana]BAD43751.1 unknown protein [Arabidopsis thaliana]BAD95173.1 hypothetical protein [Arabidopsis thaliana]|eukprot:NP_191128.1 hypothetical protein AT3G55690 [Arabidopsis thaliana]